MRVVDSNLQPIESYDLNIGHLIDITVIKEDAKPIDNIQKFAWKDEDYEKAKMYILNRKQSDIPSPDEDRDAMLIDMEYRLTILELGI